MDKFDALETQIIGISFDSLDEHRRFSKKYNIRFPLIADEEGRIRAAGYGQGRITYLIDKQGIVRYVQKGVPENEKLLEAIRGLGD